MRRSEIVWLARGWLGTPYRHQAATRGAGCDCLGLVRGVWRGLFGDEPMAVPNYRADWRDVRHADRLQRAAETLLVRAGSVQAGQVVLFTSSSYTRGRAGYSAYSATKAGVVNLTQALAEEWETSRVRINCINPQRTRTPMRTQAFGDEPVDSLLVPADVARVTLNVAASDLTGQIVTVNVAAMRNAAG